MTTLEQCIGNTPLVQLQRLAAQAGSEIWVKLEGNNPAGSVKDRAALSMIVQAEKRGEIKPGDVLIEATSGNTGIALAMIAALKGYRMKLLMPENMSQERRAAMRAYGAELILVTQEQGMEGARDLALEMAERQGRGQGARSVQQPRQPLRPLHHHRPGNLAANRRANHPFCLQHGHHRHHYRRGRFPEEPESAAVHHCRPAAGRGEQHSRHSPLGACGVYARHF